MSLNREEQQRTSAELHANLELSGLTIADLATELGTTEKEVRRALDVSRGDPVTVWRVRDRLEQAVTARGLEPRPYTVLSERMRGAAGMWFGV